MQPSTDEPACRASVRAGIVPAVPITVRPIEPDELVPWYAANGAGFLIWPIDPEASAEARARYLDFDRTIGAFEGEAVVGTFRSFPTHLTLPGGSQVPASAVTAVSVRPTHRRHGILSQMVVRDIAAGVARGDVASVLIASEWPIYGRFGYGPATWQAKWTLRTRLTRIGLEPSGSIEVVRPKPARELMPEIFRRYQAAQPGEIARLDYFWDIDLGLVDMPNRPKWQGQVAIHRDASSTPDGYVRYHGEEHWEDGIPENTLVVDELHGATSEAELDLWRYLGQTDLVATVRAETRRAREPIQWYLSDARAARVTGLTEFLWVRPYDVERLLGERTYERDGDLVLEVADEVDGAPGPAAGRYRLEAGPSETSCRRTDRSPDLTLTARAVGAASLGGTRLVDITRAGGAIEHRPGAIAEADRLFRTADEPWCSTWF
jgi:predicted acetyltransferase